MACAPSPSRSSAPDGRFVAGVNIAVQAREWSVARMLAELLPLLTATCAKISALLGHSEGG